MTQQFVLRIDIGNDAMKSENDLALAVESVANKMKSDSIYGNVYDRNGNHVGFYGVIP